jgi:hypothetical protein
MAVCKRRQVEQPIFIATADLPVSRANPCFEAVNQVMAAQGFDPFVDRAWAKF